MGEKESSGAWARVRENSTERITGYGCVGMREPERKSTARRHDALEGRQAGAGTQTPRAM